MKKLLALCLIVFVGAFGYRIAASLSPDAVALAIGVLLGILAGIPVSLLVLAASRRHQEATGQEFSRSRMNSNAYPHHQPHQPPVIVLTGGQPQYGGQQHLLQAPPVVNALPNQSQQGRFVNLEKHESW